MMHFDSCSFLCMLSAFTNTALERLVFGGAAVHSDVIPVNKYLYSDAHLNISHTVCLFVL